jgi:signal transduction histidine kinase
VKPPQWRLFPKYATLIIALVGGVLLVSGALSLLFSWREIRTHLVALQSEKAQGAATRIEQYILDIEHQLGWTAFPRLDPAADAIEHRRIEYIKLLRQVPAVTELVWIGPDGRERLRVSRLAMEAVNAGTDLSQEPAVLAAKGGKTYFGPVSFRKGTEPYMTIARPAGGDGGVTMVDVNLKFVWDVVSRLKIGVAGVAYVVDAGGTLIAHPDISLVLKKTDLRALPQVAALDRPDSVVTDARNLAGDEVLAAHARIPSLRWTVLAETPRSEALAPLYASVIRLGLLLVAALAVAAAASFFLARALVRPIRALQDGAARFGAGQLDQRIAVTSGDELEGLAEQFNQMGAALQASYAGLERKVEERTRELSQTLAQQTALGEVLRVISQSPTDVAPVFEAILDSAHRLFGSPMAAVFRYDGRLVHLVAQRNWSEEGIAQAARFYPGPPSPQRLIGRVILRRETVVIEDCQLDPDYDHVAVPWRSLVGVPLLKEGVPLGVLSLAWPEPGPVPQRQVELLQTFADQAVIAVENVRLFNETRETLERQTATAEILQVISSSVADAQPVFDAIVHSCHRLFGGQSVNLLLPQGGELVRAAMATQDAVGAPGGAASWPLDETSISGACILQARVIVAADVEAIGQEFPRSPELARAFGWRSGLFVPLLKDGVGQGCIGVLRGTTGGFSDKEIALAQTFADQAVIAIQNARLFREIEDKSRQLEAANRHKSEFLANMSHELRTPLNAIIGFSEVLTEQMFGELNDKQMEYLLDIHSSGQHLLSLINDVLDLSKIEAGKMELDLSCFDLGLLLEHSTTLVRERAQRHGLALTLEVGEGLGEWVADARKLKQAVVNLLSNAVKFTPPGGRVTLRARHRNGFSASTGHQGDWAEVSVSDTGIGIKPEDQALVFEEFRQASGDVLRKSEGTGLGLALVKRFVELHGGQVALKSAPGAGSTFTITLPALQVELQTARDETALT